MTQPFGYENPLDSSLVNILELGEGLGARVSPEWWATIDNGYCQIATGNTYAGDNDYDHMILEETAWLESQVLLGNAFVHQNGEDAVEAFDHDDVSNIRTAAVISHMFYHGDTAYTILCTKVIGGQGGEPIDAEAVTIQTEDDQILERIRVARYGGYVTVERDIEPAHDELTDRLIEMAGANSDTGEEVNHELLEAGFELIKGSREALAELESLDPSDDPAMTRLRADLIDRYYAVISAGEFEKYLDTTPSSEDLEKVRLLLEYFSRPQSS